MNFLALAALLSTTAVAPVQAFSFEAEPNAWPVHGRSAQWSAPAEEIRVGLRRSDNAIRIHAEHNGLQDYVLVELSRHDGQLITDGTYHDQKVVVLNGGYGCVDNTADFTVDRVEYNADGWTDVFAASITHLRRPALQRVPRKGRPQPLARTRGNRAAHCRDGRRITKGHFERPEGPGRELEIRLSSCSACGTRPREHGRLPHPCRRRSLTRQSA
ncbi:hypothetical protein [Lentzea sp. E54]|uniref:hypothetical protein n=1 Tax=Lentzea xerophila TaxID=3435883 RepID=UPI003DA66DB7